MNMLDALRGTIATVPQNISAGLKSFTKKESSGFDVLYLEGVDVHAGADLLNKFQGYWADIHKDSEINAAKAEDIDTVVNKIYLQIEKENEAITELMSQASLLPELAGALQATMDLIGEISSKTSELETRMQALEDLCEQQELKTNRECHLRELKHYKQRKAVEIEHMKVQLAQTHANNVAKYESTLQKSLHEKHSMFEDTYSQAISEYKTSGQTQLKTPGYMQARTSPTADLANIKIDEDTSALDEFLKDTPGANKDEASTLDNVEDIESEPDNASSEEGTSKQNNAEENNVEGTTAADSETLENSN